MKKLVENIAYWVGILTLGIIVGLTIKAVSAWVEPDQMPPEGNIAAPLNAGNVGQAKQGGLTLNIGGAAYGLIVDKGLVGIKTTNPQTDLDVNGDIATHNLNLNNNLYVGGDTVMDSNLNVNGTINAKNINLNGVAIESVPSGTLCGQASDFTGGCVDNVYCKGLSVCTGCPSGYTRVHGQGIRIYAWTGDIWCVKD